MMLMRGNKKGRRVGECKCAGGGILWLIVVEWINNSAGGRILVGRRIDVIVMRLGFLR